MYKIVTLTIIGLFIAGSAHAEQITLEQAVASPDRNKDFTKRDEARHPLEELSFFGIRPEMTVVEIWPGKGYWTEILAPF